MKKKSFFFFKGNYIDSRIEYVHEMIANIIVAPFTRALTSFSCE